MMGAGQGVASHRASARPRRATSAGGLARAPGRRRPFPRRPVAPSTGGWGPASGSANAQDDEQRNGTRGSLSRPRLRPLGPVTNTVVHPSALPQ